MKNPQEWASRTGMGFLAVVLVAIGIWAAIVFVPTISIVSLLLFVLIGGPGVFIGCKQKKAGWTLLAGFWIASWGYPFGILYMLRVSISDVIFRDFAFMVIPVIMLGTLPAWFWRLKHPSGNFSALKSAFLSYILGVLIIAPFAFSAMYDYNVRADTSLAEVMNVKVVGKYESDEGGPSLRVETLDGNSTFWVSVVWPFYDEHDVGSICEMTMRRGALGYFWVEGYR